MTERETGRRPAARRVRRRRRSRLPLLALLALAVLLLLPRLLQDSDPQPTVDPAPEESQAVVEAPQPPPPLDTSQIPERVLEAAERNPETMDYVRQYPALHDQHPEIDLSAEAASPYFPHLIQWDARWGYETYGDGLIGYTGCAPTCISMVAIYLTKDPSYTPLAVARTAEAEGYYAEGSGTPWTFLSQGCALFGLQAQTLSLSEGKMREALAQGRPIICSVGPGDFTPSGHYIVVSDWTEDGFIVRDPNSILRSQRFWRFEELSWQIRNLWAYQAV